MTPVSQRKREEEIQLRAFVGITGTMWGEDMLGGKDGPDQGVSMVGLRHPHHQALGWAGRRGLPAGQEQLGHLQIFDHISESGYANGVN